MVQKEVRPCEGMIVFVCERGALSEIAFALKFGIPVIGLDTWDIPGIVKAKGERQAVQLAINESRRLERLDYPTI